MIEYRQDLSLTVCNRLRESVGWSAFSQKQGQRALQQSRFALCAWDGQQPVGMARLVGDGIYDLLCDVVVAPEWQGNGIGKELVRRVLSWVRQNLEPGERCTVNLVANRGKEGFYEGLGFASIPQADTGHGMMLKLTGN